MAITQNSPPADSQTTPRWFDRLTPAPACPPHEVQTPSPQRGAIPPPHIVPERSEWERHAPRHYARKSRPDRFYRDACPSQLMRGHETRNARLLRKPVRSFHEKLFANRLSNNPSTCLSASDILPRSDSTRATTPANSSCTLNGGSGIGI